MVKLDWRCHTNNLLRELVENNPSASICRVPVQILLGLLHEVATRASALDDPELNVLMLRLQLYDVPVDELTATIESQRARIKETPNEDHPAQQADDAGRTVQA